jgi:hypothetical protein
VEGETAIFTFRRLTDMVVAMRSTLLPLIALSVGVASPPNAGAANRANVSADELAQAINAAGVGSVPYRKAKISSSDIRAIRCIGPDEEPTEFECTWRQRSRHGWIGRKTWVAIDGRGWHVID